MPERIGLTYSEGDLASTPLLGLLERSGVVVERASQSISANLAGPETASLLGVEVGAPLLALTRTVFDREGACVEHLQALYRPDRYAFESELRREGRSGERRWAPTALRPANSDDARPRARRHGAGPTIQQERARR